MTAFYPEMKLILSVLFLCLLVNDIRLEKNINVDILFESLCPDSYRFIRDQLYPNWRDLSSYLNIKLIPFGKSQSLQNGSHFVCQHGPKECKGNKLLSCALKRIDNQDLQVEYTNCFMHTFALGRNDENELGQVCAQEINLDLEDLISCYTSEEGIIAQLKAEQITAKTSPKFVPTILYNGEFDQTLQDESLFNFKKVVCALIYKLRSHIAEECRDSL